jgi:hypothetical protein
LIFKIGNEAGRLEDWIKRRSSPPTFRHITEFGSGQPHRIGLAKAFIIPFCLICAFGVTQMTIQTNRDLYLAIAELTQTQQHSTRSLEAYLRSLWLLAAAYQAQPNLTVRRIRTNIWA